MQSSINAQPPNEMFDAAVIGGGLVGAAIAYGMARTGARVCVLDEGDIAHRASRGNFALVWVQSKGLGMSDYARWSLASARGWPDLAALLREDTGIDVVLQQPGGFQLCLSDMELSLRVDQMRRLHNQPHMAEYPYEVLDHAETKRRLPAVGKDVAGSIYSPVDGHVNSLLLFKAVHAAFLARGAAYRPNCRAAAIEKNADGFRIVHEAGETLAHRVVIAAGLDNGRLAAMVGLNAPVRPQKGQIIVTEKTAPFLDYATVVVRQTNEGGVMIGDSQEEAGFDARPTAPILSIMAERAMKMFPLIANLNVVRTWSALRVMSPDGFPIYEQSESHPGAFIMTCHSGVTLAANHALTLAPAILEGKLPESVAAFHGRRF
jgi:hydrogen cyanide synthase HcnC